MRSATTKDLDDQETKVRWTLFHRSFIDYIVQFEEASSGKHPEEAVVAWMKQQVASEVVLALISLRNNFEILPSLKERIKKNSANAIPVPVLHSV
jgi:hypothetical protein